ncbi:MAG TPA: A/G-specific adenine glycosylase [Candidatus Bathyarchaeia archaeon]|jgi:A/G-specific adenine glycosylase|nr:A/G-specific adenine glycosylase [Candidatus Bathyarchaeia archaeon]
MPLALPVDARAAVLAWFDARGRALSFRNTRDPYAILVSEVMAQQTQISRVIEAWSRFIDRFPTVAALAAASPADVLRAWRGMGYDRRALNLHRAAHAIVDEHDGQVPRDLSALEKLPGIGPYTARAVASIAFGAPVGAVDTNVRRVLGRALGGGDELPPVALQAAADASVDPVRAGDWTHAVMDIGATLCRPGRPLCDACPLQPWCLFAASGSVAPSPPAGAQTPASQPFHQTTRWLRGRLVDRLRDAEGSAWTVIDEPIGDHQAAAIRQALEALARDGIVEVDPLDGRRARLATS